MNLPKISYSVIYNRKDITNDISDQVMGLTYTDKVAGESDEIEITIEDKDLRWQNEWYPKKGDTVQVILRFNNSQLNCGTFEIDEPEINCSTSGDIFSLKGLAAGISKSMRTKKSYAHENKSLQEIANTIASGLGLSIVGTIPDIRLNRSHQYRETDLAYLNRIGNDYGCVFSVRGTSLIFTYYKDLENRNASFTLSKQDIISCAIKDTTIKTFKSAKVKHHDPISKEVIEFAADYEDIDEEDGGSSDDLEIRSRVENKQQAEAKAKHALDKGNTAGVGGDISIPGNLLFLSGNNFQFNGIGNFSGIYHIVESTHSVDPGGGYSTSGQIKRVKKIDSTFFKTK